MRRLIVGLAAAPLGLVGPDRGAHETLHAMLWAQTAPEYRGAVQQAYRVAREQLDHALTDPRWTAAIEQTRGYSHLPTAVIVDIDETILDNSPSQARLVLRNAGFGEVWDTWVEEARAGAPPGAREFLQYAFSRRVAIFYVTNRSHLPHEAPTRRNLVRQGFPLAEEPDAVLTAGERPDWTGDKSTRRQWIAGRYRILLLVGDDLGDSLPAVRVSIDKRSELARPCDEFWGWKWILIPNAAYGSWEEAPYGHDRSLLEPEKVHHKKEALRH